MHPGIFLLQDSGLAELREQPYEAEHLLQSLIADHPHLLAGDQMDPAAARRWLLVGREMSVPSEEGGSGRWALDHLFLDQEGIPTLVEVKRSTDSRIRREVVGQMLDYAANAVVYWPQGSIRSQFEFACESGALNPDEVIREWLANDTDPEAFWQAVTTNLQAGRIRIVFVADVIPPELRRIVEFLIGQMNPAEVLAVEVRQFIGEGLTALVPRVVGQTATAQMAKSNSAKANKQQWDESSFFTHLGNQHGPDVAEAARSLYHWATGLQLPFSWGQGSRYGSFTMAIAHHGLTTRILTVWTDGRIEVKFSELATPRGGPFQTEERREELLRRLRAVPGVTLHGDVRDFRSPGIPLDVLTKPETLTQIKEVFSWVVEQIRGTIA
jgi:hypothetical protein